MPINYQALSFWFSFGQAAIVIAVGLYLFINRGNQMTKKDAEEKLDKVKTRLDGHSERISVLEENARCSPSHKDIGDLHTRINDVAGAVKEMAGTLKSMSHNVGLIHKYLLENGKGKGE